MANALKKLAQAQLGSSDAAIFTVGGATTYRVFKIVVCNTGTANLTFRLHHVDSGGSSAASNALFYDAPLAGKQTLEFGDGLVFETGQMLRGLASAASTISVTVVGVSVT